MKKEFLDCNLKQLEFELAGGLGNQLFMFYAALSLARAKNKIPMFDINPLIKSNRVHKGESIYSLGLLNRHHTIRRKAISREIFSSTRRLNGWLSRRKRLQFLGSHLSKRFYSPEEVGYVDPAEIEDSVCFISGYFQTWRYFDETPDELKNPFKEARTSQWFQELADHFRNFPPISLHIRRGDYALAKNSHIGLLSSLYYENFLSKIDTNNEVWVFSDDIEEAKKMLTVSANTRFKFVNPPANSDAFESMLLMSYSQKLCIANSTFSWWAGMLTGKDSEVYAPSKWFKDLEEPNQLIPQNWKRLESVWKDG
jgi:hypothetical protein